MYYGNSKATPADDVKATFDANQVAVYHFDETEGLPQDRSGKGNNATQSGAKVGEGSLVGRGATFDGGNTITVPASPTLKLVAAQGFTVSAWIKTAVVQNSAVLFQQQDGPKSISLSISGGKLVAAFGATETPRTMDVTPGVWHHVALTAGQVLTVYLDGKEIAQAPVTLADMQGDITFGKLFTGEMDELKLSNVARSADWIKIEAESQGADALLVGYGQDEANGGGGTSYFGTILHSVTTDGWVVIGILIVMALISWVVMGLKAVVISKVQKGNKAFLLDYGKLSITETAKLDQAQTEEDAEIENSQLLIALYGKHDHYQDSTLYHIYHTGIQEIKNRFANVEASQQYLSPQAIGAIKASLDATLVRENQKLGSLMVLLTIAISGGPFLGLLGTVVGVMITFAAIAATGDVNVAAIAPGIAAALVATVAGLAVAIPALFGYNYLGSLIKNTSADMHIFVDEYISRITEFYSR
jgi:biopolymer transport protein ExbB